jgi:hypothetical protein
VVSFWQKVVNVAAQLYKLLLHGKTVGGVTWPEQGQGPSPGPSGQPHQPGPPLVRGK